MSHCVFVFVMQAVEISSKSLSSVIVQSHWPVKLGKRRWPRIHKPCVKGVSACKRWTCGKHNQPDDKMSTHPTGFLFSCKKWRHTNEEKKPHRLYWNMTSPVFQKPPRHLFTSPPPRFPPDFINIHINLPSDACEILILDDEHSFLLIGCFGNVNSALFYADTEKGTTGSGLY